MARQDRELAGATALRNLVPTIGHTPFRTPQCQHSAQLSHGAAIVFLFSHPTSRQPLCRLAYRSGGQRQHGIVLPTVVACAVQPHGTPRSHETHLPLCQCVYRQLSHQKAVDTRDRLATVAHLATAQREPYAALSRPVPLLLLRHGHALCRCRETTSYPSTWRPHRLPSPEDGTHRKSANRTVHARHP